MIKMQIRIIFQETNIQLFLCHTCNLQNLMSYFFGFALRVQLLFRNVKCYILDIPFLLQTLVCQVPLL